MQVGCVHALWRFCTQHSYCTRWEVLLSTDHSRHSLLCAVRGISLWRSKNAKSQHQKIYTTNKSDTWWTSGPQRFTVCYDLSNELSLQNVTTATTQGTIKGSSCLLLLVLVTVGLEMMSSVSRWFAPLYHLTQALQQQVCCVHALWRLFCLFTTLHITPPPPHTFRQCDTVLQHSARDKHHCIWKCSIQKTIQFDHGLPWVQWHQQDHQLECTLTISPLSLDTHIVCSDSGA